MKAIGASGDCMKHKTSPLKRRFNASNGGALRSTMATISTQRVQQFRTRQRTGKILLTIEVDEVLLVEALIEARLLYRHLADDHRAITRALEKAVAAFCKEQTL
jgi:hypothetical protein